MWKQQDPIYTMPQSTNQCRMGLGSQQNQGVLKLLITLTPVLRMRAQDKNKMVVPP